MLLHDSHAHLDFLLFKLGLIPNLERANPEMVVEYDHTVLVELLKNHELLLQATISTQNLEVCWKLFHDNPKVLFQLGTHPEYVGSKLVVQDYVDYQNQFLESAVGKTMINEQRLIGVGEIGLDYHYTQDSEIIKKQKELFRSQIELALTMNLPFQIHTRDAFSDTVEILKDYPEIGGKFIVHCFSEGVEEAKKILDLGGYLGFGGLITFNSALAIQDAAKYCPNDRFFLETDLPFLSPPPYRGKTCLPEYIDLIAQKMTVLKPELSKDEVWVKARENFKQLYNY
jgi:TatD DNase family protein